jgi:hypothetical protein
MEIEKYIKNSWDKVPQEFKNRASEKDLQIILGNVNLRKGDMVDEVEGGRIVFFRRGIEQKIQEMIDEMVLNMLFTEYGFSEEEGHKLLKAFSK